MTVTNLNLASDRFIKKALQNLKAGYGINNSWVPGNNKYVVNTIGGLLTDLRAGTIQYPDIVDYIASSSIIHCFNSWSYLTVAVNSYVEGDYGNAVHNAYYSQLRSIMSFLASQGVGTFMRGCHIIIDGAGIAKRAQSDALTHDFVKEAFDQWLNDSSNTSKILNLISVQNFGISDWFNNAGFSRDLAGLNAARLLRAWSVDIDV